MRAGELKRKVSILRQGTGQDDYGSPDGSWGTLLEARAKVEPLGGLESLTNQEKREPGDYRVTLRYHHAHAAVTTADRVRYGQQTLGIDAIIRDIDVRGSRATIIDCSKVDA